MTDWLAPKQERVCVYVYCSEEVRQVSETYSLGYPGFY